MSNYTLKTKELLELYPSLVIEHYFPDLQFSKSELDKGYVVSPIPAIMPQLFKTELRFGLSNMNDETIVDFLTNEGLPSEMEIYFLNRKHKFSTIQERMAFAQGFKTKLETFEVVECDEKGTHTKHRITLG